MRRLARPIRTVVMFVVMVALSGCSPRNEPARRADGSVPTNGATAVERPAEAPALAPGGEGGAAHVPFRARGNEPGWSLEIGDRDMRLLADYGDLQLAGPAPAPVTAGDTTRYSARPQGHLIEVTVVHRLCHDGMSGFPYPSIVTVRLDGRELHGCGGERLDADSSAAPPAR